MNKGREAYFVREKGCIVVPTRSSLIFLNEWALFSKYEMAEGPLRFQNIIIKYISKSTYQGYPKTATVLKVKGCKHKFYNFLAKTFPV